MRRGKVEVRLQIRDSRGSVAVKSLKSVKFVEEDELMDILLRYMHLRARVKLSKLRGNHVSKYIQTRVRIAYPGRSSGTPKWEPYE
jgi:hypothetical protein